MSNEIRSNEDSTSLNLNDNLEEEIGEFLEEADFDKESVEVYTVTGSLEDEMVNVFASRYENSESPDYRTSFMAKPEDITLSLMEEPEPGDAYIIKKKDAPETASDFMEYADQMLERDIEGESYEEILTSLTIQHNHRMESRGREEMKLGKKEYSEKLTEILDDYRGIDLRKFEPPTSQ